jgi:predicted HTH domain antitoxin
MSSIDFLIDQLSPYICFPLGESAGYNLQDVFDRAKEIHKDEIIDAYETSHISMMKAEQYYNETFSKEQQRELLKEMIQADEKDGLYDDWDTTLNDGIED